VKWFRFYHEVLDDPKVQDLEPAVFKHWVNLLCLANDQEPRGTLPDNPRFIAFRLRIRDATAAKLIAELTDRGLLEKAANCRLSLHNWEKRQAKSDDSAPRVARSRGASPENNRVNVTAEPPLLKRDNSSLDIEEEGDTENHSPTESGDPAAPDAPSAQLRLHIPKSQTTDAVRAANTVLGKKCNEAERAAINEAVPATPQAQTLWESCLRRWKLRYERNKGLEGPLDWFTAGGAPEKPAHANGRTNARPAQNSAVMNALEVIDEALGSGSGAGGVPRGGGRPADPAVGARPARHQLHRQLPG
jgi:hypothetical protein